MRSDQRPANPAACGEALATWHGARPQPARAPVVAGCPPVIEEWLRASRLRLLKRYGGVVAPRSAIGRGR